MPSGTTSANEALQDRSDKPTLLAATGTTNADVPIRLVATSAGALKVDLASGDEIIVSVGTLNTIGTVGMVEGGTVQTNVESGTVNVGTVTTLPNINISSGTLNSLPDVNIGSGTITSLAGGTVDVNMLSGTLNVGTTVVSGDVGVSSGSIVVTTGTVTATDLDIRDLTNASDSVAIYGSDDGGTTKRIIKTDVGGAIQVDLEVASVNVTSGTQQTLGTVGIVESGTIDTLSAIASGTQNTLGTVGVVQSGSIVVTAGTVVTNETETTDFEGAPVTVGTIAVEMTFTGITQSIALQSDQSNTGAVWFGKSNITSAGANAFGRLDPGRAVTLELNDAGTAVYTISDSAAQTVFKMALL